MKILCVKKMAFLLAFLLILTQANVVQAGPDVIVGDIAGGINEYGTVGSIAAYAFETVSCNVGNQVLLWESWSNQHPVIAQNMFRLKNGQFEQIGQAWLKHGFCALSMNLCASCQGGTGCEALGVGCSDPYSAGLNGQQSNLGPKSEVNASTGYFPYDFCVGGWCPPPSPNSVNRRLQVHTSDLEPGNPSVLYFLESQYVAPDDATTGNGDNNASWRQVSVNSVTNISTIGSTVRSQPAILAWVAQDASVMSAKLSVPDEGGPGVSGRLWLAAKTTDLGGGWWHYEYALQNLNSDRSVQAFSVPIPSGAQVINLGFHDVDYHSGEPYSLTDWAGTVDATSVSWATETYAQNTDANALRWGTLYNFRFDANVPPEQNGTVDLVLFKPGTPASITGTITTPSQTALCACPGDLDGSNTVDGSDITSFVDMYLGNLAVDPCAELQVPHGVPLDMGDLAEFVTLLLSSQSCP